MKLTKLQSLEEIVFQVNGNKKFLDKAVKEVDIICENLFSCYCGEIGEESAVMLKKAEILERALTVAMGRRDLLIDRLHEADRKIVVFAYNL